MDKRSRFSNVASRPPQQASLPEIQVLVLTYESGFETCLSWTEEWQPLRNFQLSRASFSLYVPLALGLRRHLLSRRSRNYPRYHNIIHQTVENIISCEAAISNAFTKRYQGYRSIFGFRVPFGRKIWQISDQKSVLDSLKGTHPNVFLNFWLWEYQIPEKDQGISVHVFKLQHVSKCYSFATHRAIVLFN